MSCVLLHNLRTEVVGVNQIRTVFDGNYGEYFNLEGYDHIGRYFADIIDWYKIVLIKSSEINYFF
jgi:hypothetical protein